MMRTGAAAKAVVRTARRAVLASFDFIGGNRWLAASRWRRERLLILCYHGVSLRDEHEWNPNLFVTPKFLRNRFQILRDGGYAVLPLGAAVDALASESLPPRAVALTFDDGFHNFAAAAVPILREFDFPATVYVSSYYAVNQRPILGLALSYMLWCARDRRISGASLGVGGGDVALSTVPARRALTAALLADARRFSDDRRAETEWLASIAGRLGVDYGALTSSRVVNLMSEDEIRHVARLGFDVQLHTHRHTSTVEEGAFGADLAQNRQILERLTHRPSNHFCYPSGDYRPELLQWLRRLGVVSATTCDAGLAGPRQEPLLLPRFIDTMGQSAAMFKSWIAGSAAFVSGRGR